MIFAMASAYLVRIKSGLPAVTLYYSCVPVLYHRILENLFIQYYMALRIYVYALRIDEYYFSIKSEYNIVWKVVYKWGFWHNEPF